LLIFLPSAALDIYILKVRWVFGLEMEGSFLGVLVDIGDPLLF
jgi:hypothetical protein